MVGLEAFERLQMRVVEEECDLDLEGLRYDMTGLAGLEFDRYE